MEGSPEREGQGTGLSAAGIWLLRPWEQRAGWRPGAARGAGHPRSCLEPRGCRRRPALYVVPGDSQPISACATAESRLHGPCRHQALSCRRANAHVDKSPARLQGLGGAIPTRKRGPESALCPRP